MVSSAFASELLIVLCVATLTALVFERFRLPALLGFILAGTVIGPHGFGWIADIHRVHELAEIGMIFLMLTIGLEFSFDRLKGLKKTAFVGGSAQVLLSVALSIAVSLIMGWTIYQGFVLGSVIALSSTAVVFRNLIDRGQLETQHGRICVAILVFQDLAVGPLLIFINSFGGSGGTVAMALAVSLVKAALLLGALLGASRFVLPKLMRWITLSKSREIFMLATVLLCFGTSWISAKLGLSAPLGAFFAGLMLANTEYHHQIAGEVMPFRHIFLSIFFVSIGLLFDPMFSLMNWHTVVPVAGLILFVNVIVIAVVLLALGYSPRVAVTTGIILSQIGEFSFLLLENAKNGGLILPVFYQTVLSAAVLTILLTPFMFNLIPPVMRLFAKIPFFGMAPQPKEKTEKTRRMKDHIVLCGYGTAGQDLAGALTLENVPFVVIEMSPMNIEKARGHRVPVLYGDAMNESVLHEAAVARAKAVVISFGDASGIAMIIRAIQKLNPETMIVARCRYERDVAWLYELGADVVVMEELEVSSELTRVILDKVGLAEELIHTHMLRIRARKEFLVEQNILKKLR
jgi:monovalent cation:H+ antiporter-2, CPA2 family